jgi:predicted GIY-YIG superfamily endonuclease
MNEKNDGYYVYILKLYLNGEYSNLYVGQTNNLERRLAQHKKNMSKNDRKTYTGRFDDLKLAKAFIVNSRKAALDIEKKIKGLPTYKKHNLIEGTLSIDQVKRMKKKKKKGRRFHGRYRRYQSKSSD